jgi:hypothetical protein
MNTWEKNLKEGNWFQRHIAYPWLIRHRPQYFITPTSTDTNPINKGPKLYRGSDAITLPDFRLDDPMTKESRWLDAKMKKSPFSLPSRRGEKFYSIDPRTYKEYLKICTVFNYMPFEILLGCQETKLLYNFDLTKCKPTMHFFQNKYVRSGNNETPCFNTLDMKIVGRWDPSHISK